MGSSSLGRTCPPSVPDEELEVDAASSKQAARQAAEARGPAGGCQQVGAQWSVPAHKPLRDAISCTHLRRRKRSRNKRRGKTGDNSGSDEVSSMGGSGIRWGRRLVQAVCHINICRVEHDDDGGSGEGDVGDDH